MNASNNSATWQIDCWLGSKKYAYVMATTISVWKRFRPNSAIARRELAGKWRRDVMANADKIDAEIDLLEVDWLELADYQLKMMANYRPMHRESNKSGS